MQGSSKHQGLEKGPAASAEQLTEWQQAELDFASLCSYLA